MGLTAYHASKQPDKKPAQDPKPADQPVAQTAPQPGNRQGNRRGPRPDRNGGQQQQGDRPRRRNDRPRDFRPPKKKMVQRDATPGIHLRDPKAAAQPARVYQPPVNKLRVISLGGMGEVGMNMTVFEYGNDMIVVDAGGLFPSESMPGIDLVIQDISYLINNRHKLRGIIFTHGHEDHISALPYHMPRLGNVPLYTLPLTAVLIESKFAEHNINQKINVVKARDSLTLGVFTVDLFTLTHSVPDTVGLGIHTPEGIVAYCTDWKFDHTPVWGEPCDYAKLIQMSEEGVLLLMSDSTNADVAGYTISEQVVQADIDKIFKMKQGVGRIIFGSFSSNINRLQMAINCSAKYGRKVAVSGRSMERNVTAAIKLGYVHAPKDILVDIRNTANIPDDKLTIICTGSQGEEYSALVRMASGEHRQVKIKQGDSVLISASRIPGNEHAINETIDNLFRQGAEVIYGGELDIHTSGHAKQEELKMMIAMLKPKYFLPLHGEYRMLKAHAKLALEMGVKAENIFVGENGAVFEVDQGRARWAEKVPASYVMIDGLGVGDVGNIVLRDRQAMAEEGIFMIILTVNKRAGTLAGNPDIISRGFVYMRDAKDLIQKARHEINRLFDHHNKKAPMDWEYVKRAIRDDLGQFLFDYTQRRPMVIPVIIEV